jgi:hypothetical protein
VVRVQHADWREVGGGKSLPSRVCYVLKRSRRLRKDLYLAETVFLHRSWPVDLNPQKLVDIYVVGPHLLHLLVLGFGFLQDGDVGIGVFPEGEEVLIGGTALGSVALESVGTGETEMRECPQREIQDDTAMIEEFLELGSGCGAVVGHELGLAAQVHRVQSSLLRRWWLAV